ncbi:MAG: hypothetical protein WB760_12005 [Xanthobacteraceae bacterium]
MPVARRILGALQNGALGRRRRMSPEQRGVELLLANLTPTQRRQYRRDRHFDVIGGQSGTRYRLWHCFQQNIEELDADGRRRWVWCFHPRETLVLGDVLLAQKTSLELCEGEALRIAHGYSNFGANAGPMSRLARDDFERTVRKSWHRRLVRSLHSSFRAIKPQTDFYRVTRVCIVAAAFSCVLTRVVYGSTIFH